MKTVVLGTLALILVCACASSSPSVAASSPSPALSASPSPVTDFSPAATPAASPVASPVPVSDLPPFQCSDQSGSGTPGPITPVTDVRVGAQTGYDRFVAQFSTAIPSYTVMRQATSAFTTDPKGERVTLGGTAGVLVTLKPIDWTSYAGPTDLKPGFTYLREARQVQNFEGTQQWGLGIQGTPCLRVFTLTSPLRLVVDVQSA